MMKTRIRITHIAGIACTNIAPRAPNSNSDTS